jgi:hypothetical protein
MRLSEWRKAAPNDAVLDDSVIAVVGPVLGDLGAETDPECWIAWGDDPDVRYSLLAPTPIGLITLAIRFTTQEDGPRVIAKLIRWSKVSVSELGVESGSGRRIVAVQVENVVLKGVDEEADRICEFVRMLIAGVDDRQQSLAPFTAIGTVAPMLAPQVGAAPRVSVRNLPAKPSADPAAVEAKTSPAPGAAAVKAVPKPGKPAAGPSAATAVAPPGAARHAEQTAPQPTPIAARAAARLGAAEASAAPPDAHDGEPEPETDRSGWVSPHAIEVPSARKPAKPRTWIP